MSPRKVLKKMAQAKKKDSEKSTADSQATDSLFKEDNVIGSCHECKQDIVESRDSGLIMCERCDEWICRACAGMNAGEWDIMSEFESFHWFCKDCESIAMAAVDCSKKIDGKKVSLPIKEIQKQVLSRIEKAVNSLVRKIESVDTGLEEQTRETRRYTEAVQHESNNIKIQMTDQMSNLKKDLIKLNKSTNITVEESREREARKCNIILFGVPESKSNDVEIRKIHDTEKFKEVCIDGLEMEVEVSSVHRLRSKNEVSPRPLKVKVLNEQTKWKILKNAKKLAKAKDHLREIYVKRDMTVLEREKDLELRTELRKKREESLKNLDGGVWIIRKERVVNIARKQNQEEIEIDLTQEIEKNLATKDPSRVRRYRKRESINTTKLIEESGPDEIEILTTPLIQAAQRRVRHSSGLSSLADDHEEIVTKASVH